MIGRVHLFLESIVIVDDFFDLNQRLNRLKQEVRKLEELVEQGRSEEKLHSILNMTFSF